MNNKNQRAVMKWAAAGVLCGGLLSTIPHAEAKPMFRLPLAANTASHSYYDHNAGTGWTDWKCQGETYNGHKGTDFPAPRNTPIYAAAAGTLVAKHDGEGDGYYGNPGLANSVIIDHGGGYRTLYWHMNYGTVTTKALGSSIACGELIGKVGMSGNASGLHLHFESQLNGVAYDPYTGSCSAASSSWVNQNGGNPVTTCSAPPPPAPCAPRVRFKMDVNGDGKTDIVLIYKNGTAANARTLLSDGSGYTWASDNQIASSWANPGVDRMWVPMDANGDGKTDLVLIYKNGSAATARLFTSDGNSFGMVSDSTVHSSFGTLEVNRQWSKGDVNGDGKEDLILAWSNAGAGKARTCLSSGTGFSITSDSDVSSTWGTLNVDRQWVNMDVNGDGKMDVVLLWNDGGAVNARVRLSNGTSFVANSGNQIASVWGTLGVDRIWYTGDVNGDGKQDFILVYNDAGAGTARVLLSNGSTFSLASDTVMSSTWGTLGVDRLFVPMDVNGDAKTDLVLLWKDGGAASARVKVSNGNDFDGISDNQIASVWGTLGDDRMWITGDVNGDLKQDFILAYNDAGAGSARSLVSNGSSFSMSSDSSICSIWGTLGVDRLWIPSGK